MLPDSCSLTPAAVDPDELLVKVHTHAELTYVELINVTRNRFLVLQYLTDPRGALRYAVTLADLLDVDIKVDPAVLKEALK